MEIRESVFENCHNCNCHNCNCHCWGGSAGGIAFETARSLWLMLGDNGS